MVADSPRLSSTGLRLRAHRLEQREVLHVARADLQHVGVARRPARRRAVSITSVTIGSPVFARASARIFSPSSFIPWNA